jgi:Ca2+-binding EF-hand superfamily protein
MQIASAVQDEIDEMFDRIDDDGDRYISFDEFARLLIGMDHSKSPASVRPTFESIDTDRDGRVSFDEFRTWILR